MKAIYTLQQRGESASTNALCAQLGGIKPGSVSGMLRQLEERGLIVHQLYRGARLTPAGERVALGMVRNHRLLETFLVEALGYSWDEVHAEAEALEHHISPKLAARIAAWLGEPTTDPHGDPIPRPDGTLPGCSDQRLSDAPVDRPLVIVRVLDQDAARLRYLAELGLTPGATCRVAARAPFDGPLQLCVAGKNHPLDHQLAHQIVVREQ
ncbi:MAG: metal-dependent transcriptional regulator [Chloroflexi bacterium OHK40]